MNHKSLFKLDPKSAEPVTEFSMRAAYKLDYAFDGGTKTVMVYYAVASYVGLMLALAYLARRVAGCWRPALLAVLLFVSSSWPITYLILFSYSPFMTFCIWLAWALLACSMLKERFSALPAAFAGLAAVAGIGCSVAAAVAVMGLGLVMIGLLRHPVTGKWRIWPAVSFSVTVLAFGILLWVGFKDGYRNRVTESLTDPSVMDASRRFGLFFDAPFSLPFPSGLWVLWTHSKTLACALVVASILVLGMCLRILLIRPRPAPNLLRRCLAILAAALWAEAISIDILGTPKLGRSHFLWFPGACLLIALCLSWVGSLVSPRRKWVVGLCGLLVLTGSAFEGIVGSHRLWKERYALPRELEQHHQHLQNLYLLGNDPHSYWLARWLDEWPTNLVTPDALFKLVTSAHSNEMVLLVGPTGNGSGRSVLMHSSLQDFEFPIDYFAQDSHALMKLLPYFAFDHALAHEERVTQGMLSDGRIPDPSTEPGKNLRLLYWPPLAGPKPPAATQPEPGKGAAKLP